MRRNILILAAVMPAAAGTTFAQAQRPIIETRKVEDAGATIIAHRRAKERRQVIEDPYTPLPDEVVDTQRTLVLGDTAIELTYVGPSTKKDVEDRIALPEYASQLVREQARAGRCWRPAENELQLDRYKDMPNDANGRPYVVRRYCGLWGREPDRRAQPDRGGYDAASMHISAEEIKEFWRGYCERRNIPKDLVARGEAEIEKNPEYWADRTMDELQRLVAGGSGTGR